MFTKLLTEHTMATQNQKKWKFGNRDAIRKQFIHSITNRPIWG